MARTTAAKSTPANGTVVASAAPHATTDVVAQMAAMQVMMAQMQEQLNAATARAEEAELRAEEAEAAKASKPVTSLFDGAIKVNPIMFKEGNDDKGYHSDSDGYRVTGKGAYAWTFKGNGFGGTFWMSAEKTALSDLKGAFYFVAEREGN